MSKLRILAVRGGADTVERIVDWVRVYDPQNSSVIELDLGEDPAHLLETLADHAAGSLRDGPMIELTIAAAEAMKPRGD